MKQKETKKDTEKRISGCKKSIIQPKIDCKFYQVPDQQGVK